MEYKSDNPMMPTLTNCGLKVFRFDDVSVNTDMFLLGDISRFIIEKFPTAKLIYCVSPMCHLSKDGRVFPKVFNAMADYRKFYTPDTIGFPVFNCAPGVFAGHGLVHVNHQLLDYQAQEMSILTSCSLANNAKIFLPPWNKWNEVTEIICEQNDIELIKFEDGWRSAEHCEWDSVHNLWYLHSYCWTLDTFKKWFENGSLH